MSSPFDLHVLSTPPAFILSQDQTLNKMVSKEPFGSLNQFYWSLIHSFKEIFKSLSAKLLLVKRTSCPLLVLRVSSRCLIYKVHALPQRQELIQYIILFCCCQVLFSNFFRSFSAPKVQIQNSHPAAHRSRSELLYDIMSCFACQVLFHFVVSRQARPKRCTCQLGHSLAESLSILPPHPQLVNTFLLISSFYFSRVSHRWKTVL